MTSAAEITLTIQPDASGFMQAMSRAAEMWERLTPTGVALAVARGRIHLVTGSERHRAVKRYRDLRRQALKRLATRHQPPSPS